MIWTITNKCFQAFVLNLYQTHLCQLQAAQRFLFLQQIAQRRTHSNERRNRRESFYYSKQVDTIWKLLFTQTDIVFIRLNIFSK